MAQEHPVGQQRAGHADELRHATIHPTNAGEHIAQHKVEQALHGRKQQAHRNTLAAVGFMRRRTIKRKNASRAMDTGVISYTFYSKHKNS